MEAHVVQRGPGSVVLSRPGWLEREVTPRLDSSSRQRSPRRVWIEEPANKASWASRSRTVRRIAGRRLSLQRGHGRGTLPSPQHSPPVWASHADIVAPLPAGSVHRGAEATVAAAFCTGELVTAIGMTRPSGGSDLAALEDDRCGTATSGCSNGPRPSSPTATRRIWSLWRRARRRAPVPADQSVRCCRGDDGGLLPWSQTGQGRTDRERHLELFFDNVRVPTANLIGELDRGFIHMMERLPQNGSVPRSPNASRMRRNP